MFPVAPVIPGSTRSTVSPTNGTTTAPGRMRLPTCQRSQRANAAGRLRDAIGCVQRNRNVVRRALACPWRDTPWHLPSVGPSCKHWGDRNEGRSPGLRRERETERNVAFKGNLLRLGRESRRLGADTVNSLVTRNSPNVWI